MRYSFVLSYALVSPVDCGVDVPIAGDQPWRVVQLHCLSCIQYGSWKGFVEFLWLPSPAASFKSVGGWLVQNLGARMIRWVSGCFLIWWSYESVAVSAVATYAASYLQCLDSSGAALSSYGAECFVLWPLQFVELCLAQVRLPCWCCVIEDASLGGDVYFRLLVLKVTWHKVIWLNFFESFGLIILIQMTTKLSQVHSNSSNG